MMAAGLPIRPALVVVDVQEDFCPPNGSLAVPGGREIAAVINKLLELPFVLKIATQDWHPHDHISFASTHGPEFRPFESFAQVKNPQNEAETEQIRLWPDHCVQNTPGAELLPELDVSRIQHIVKKGQDRRTEMFSAFRDTYKSPSGSESGLLKTLKDAGVTDVYVVGLALDYCVKHTALHAQEDGFRTYIIEDACRAIPMGDDGDRKFRAEMAERGVRLTTTTSPDFETFVADIANEQIV